MADVTRILNAIERGDPKAAEELLPLVYDELRHLAAQKLSHEPPGQTLQATALVHEAYIRLVEAENQDWKGRAHFFKAAAEAMRRILVENARRKKTHKYGGDIKKVDFENEDLALETYLDINDLLALDEALTKLRSEICPCTSILFVPFVRGNTLFPLTSTMSIVALVEPATGSVAVISSMTIWLLWPSPSCLAIFCFSLQRRKWAFVK